MGISSALSIATASLANVTSQLALISHNVANADTPGYVAETATQSSATEGGIGLGVVTGPTTRNLDTAVQAQAFQQNSLVAGLQTTQAALQAIDAVQGTPGQGDDIASQLGALQDQFSTLLNDPSNQTQQQAVVSSAGTLTQTINALSNVYTAQRQTAQNNIVGEVGTINATLATIGQLSDQIVTLQSGGQSTADLQNQRDAAVQVLGQLVSVQTLMQPNGDMLITTAGGAALPIHGVTDPLATSAANVLPGTTYPAGGIPPITLDGVDVTGQLTGGQLGANVTLRDVTLPTYQARAGRVLAEPGRPVFDAGADIVLRSVGQCAGRWRHAGANRLCRILCRHPGQSGGRARSVGRARRHQRQHPARRALHAQSCRRTGRVQHADRQRADLRARRQCRGWRAAGAATALQHQRPWRLRHA